MRLYPRALALACSWMVFAWSPAVGPAHAQEPEPPASDEAPPTSQPVEQSCPEGWLRDVAEGVLRPEDAPELAARLAAVGVDACARPLFQMAMDGLTGRTPEGVAAVAVAWADPRLMPLLYRAYGAGMFQPHERSNDLALPMADAIATLSPEGADLLAPVATGDIGGQWLDLAVQRFQVEWGPNIEAGELRPPTFTNELRDAALERLRACLRDPSQVPPDTFDPLGLLEGPGAELSVGTRCTTLAVVDIWGAAGDVQWRDYVEGLLRRYTPMGDFMDLAAGLERQWNQGRGQWRDGGPPPRHHWSPVDANRSQGDESENAVRTSARGAEAGPFSTGSPHALVGVLALVLLLVGLSARKAGTPPQLRARMLKAAAVGFGLVLLLAIEGALWMAGIPPGDEGRPTGRLSISVDPPPGRPDILLDLSGKAVPMPPPEGRVRLGIAGASSVAGMNLAHRDSMASHLERQLRADLPCVDVLNFGQPGLSLRDVRGMAVAAMDGFQMDGMILYSGHNEVGAAREHGDYRGLRSRLSWLEVALVRTHLAGLVRQLRGPREPLGVQDDGSEQENSQSMDLHHASFEAAVNARYERDLIDLARAFRRRNMPLVLTMPSFNHHGLRLQAVSVEAGSGVEEDGTTLPNRLRQLLLDGDGREAVVQAAVLRDQVPRHGAPYLLLALAHELEGSVEEAEAAIWEAARRNQIGSALTPGIAAVVWQVAEQFSLPVADAHAALHEASPGHLPGFDLFLDFVHLNPRGSEVVAAEMRRTLVTSGLVEEWSSRCAP